MATNQSVPTNYQTVMPYLILPDAKNFIAFAIDIFEATEISKVLSEENTIMHAEIRIGDCIIMLGDSTEQYPPQPAGLFIFVDNADTTYAKAIKAGAKAVTPLSDQPYGRSGGVKDPHGNTWWITSIIEKSQ